MNAFIDALKAARPLVEEGQYICHALEDQVQCDIAANTYKRQVLDRIDPYYSFGTWLVENGIIGAWLSMHDEIPYRLKFIDHMIAGLPGTPQYPKLESKASVENLND